MDFNTGMVLIQIVSLSTLRTEGINDAFANEYNMSKNQDELGVVSGRRVAPTNASRDQRRRGRHARFPAI